jgi:hypothetical protein
MERLEERNWDDVVLRYVLLFELFKKGKTKSRRAFVFRN